MYLDANGQIDAMDATASAPNALVHNIHFGAPGSYQIRKVESMHISKIWAEGHWRAWHDCLW